MDAASVKLEDALPPAVEVRDHGGKEEEEDAAQPHARLGGARREVGEGRRPRVEEDDLDVEDEEDDGDEVEPHVEALAGGADRVHARLVRQPLHLARAARAEELAQHDVGDREGDRHQDDHDQREVARQVGRGQRQRQGGHAGRMVAGWWRIRLSGGCPRRVCQFGRRGWPCLPVRSGVAEVGRAGWGLRGEFIAAG
uniref:Uncharacterized protein n=1 Tax=Tolypothrix bouteillei VB521301 TaxID=1479485 RepID=A0A0C1RHX3_9CYAN